MQMPDNGNRGDRENETHDDGEVDDQFRALLEGLRTSLPGVQVLFAFLLIAPFQGEFNSLSTVERAAFLVAFYSSAIASVLLIAPSVHQRLRAPSTGLRRGSKRHLIVATWVTIFGTIAMGVAWAATVYLVSSIVHQGSVGFAATACFVALLSWAWFYLPLIAFQRGKS
jgi:hypothetical protein